MSLRTFKRFLSDAIRLPMDLSKYKCTGCGSSFQTTSQGPGYINLSCVDRIVLKEKPRGMVPILLSPSPIKANNEGGNLGRLDIERLRKRFGLVNDAPVSVEIPIEKEAAKKDTMKELVCERCHGLTHYGVSCNSDTSNSTKWLSKEDTELLSNQLHPDSLLVYIVDLVDWPHSNVTDLYSLLPKGLNMPLLLVGNKIDLLPGHGTSTVVKVSESLKSAAIHSKLNLIDVTLISAKSGFNVDKLKGQMIDYATRVKQSVFLIGRTNVGKSLLYNSLSTKKHPAYIYPKSTVSSTHGTTIGILKKRLAFIGPNPVVKIPKNLWLFDIPGINYQSKLESLFTKNEIKQLVISTKLEPICHTLLPGETGLIGGFCRIDIQTTEPISNAKVQLELFMNRSLPYFRKPSMRKADEAMEALQGIQVNPPPSLCPPVFESCADPRRDLFKLNPTLSFQLEPSVSSEAVLSDNLGWITFKSEYPVQITVSLPSGINASLRPYNYKL